MKPVTFTRHAVDKLELLQQWGFQIGLEKISSGLANPHEISPGYLGRSIARPQLVEGHILRVVYEENSELLVITMYPARQDRYED